MKLNVTNPHDQSTVGQLPISTKNQIKQTVKKAKEAFVDWRLTSVSQRVKYIKKYRELVKKNQSKIAKLISLEMGKPITQANDDVTFELGFLDYYIKNTSKFLADEVVLQETGGKKAGTFTVTFEPYGVCVCIAPWNFPLSMANSGVIPALLAGNTVILKPSEYTSLTQKMVIELLNQTGLPDGVANLLIGSGEVGEQLLDEPIDLAWFTGSTAVGQKIYKKCAEKFIKALLEMGGSSPGIVFADADLDNTLENLYWARYLNCGQVCTAVKRLYVQEPIFDQVVELFVERVMKMKIGDPLDSKTDIGPLVSKKQLKLLQTQVADALQKGAKVEIGGGQPSEKNLKNGNYFLPTILTKIKPSMRVITEEVFGPVLPIIPFKTEDEVIKMANNSEYGLSAEIYTKDIKKAQRMAKLLDVGTVAINTDNFFKPECPFGGYKKSGMGREYGEIGMREFSQVKLTAVVK